MIRIDLTAADRRRLNEIADQLANDLPERPTLASIIGISIAIQHSQALADGDSAGLDIADVDARQILDRIQATGTPAASLSLSPSQRVGDGGGAMTAERRRELLALSGMEPEPMTPERRKELLDKYAPLPAF